MATFLNILLAFLFVSIIISSFVTSDGVQRRYRPGIHSAKLFAVLILSFSLILTYALWINARDDALHLQQDEFDTHVKSIADGINKRIDAYAQIMRGVSAFYAGSQFVDRGEYREYINHLDLQKNYPGAQSIRFVQFVPDSEKEKHIAAIRKESSIGSYSIWPEGQREAYAPVVYAEPFDMRNQQVFGYDMLSDLDYPRPGEQPGMRHTALGQARDSGNLAISGKIRLVFESTQSTRYSFAMMIPVYKNGLPHNTVEERRTNLYGWIVSVFRMSDLMSGAIDEHDRGFDIDIFDGDEISEKTLMYDPDDNFNNVSNARYQQSQHFKIAGHEWTLRIRSTPEFEAKISRNQPDIIAASGIAISLLLSLLGWFIVRNRIKTMETTEALSQSEAQLRLLLNSAAEGIYGIDMDGNCTFCNPACFRMLGYSNAADLIGKNMHELIHYKHPDETLFPKEECRIYQAFLAGTKAHVEDEVFWRADDTCFPVEYWSHPEIDHGTVTGAVVTFIDITERKASNKKLMTLSKAVEKSPASVVITDPEGTIEYVNPRFTEVTGYTAGEAIGQNPRILKSGKLSPKFYESMWQTLLANKTWHGEFHNRKKNGEDYFEAASISPIHDEDGKIAHFVAVKEDITERKHTEQQLKKSMAAAEAASRAKSEFLANMSHEIRTPMNAIIGFTHLCMQGELAPLQRNYLEKVRRSASSLLGLINDILDFSKIEAGKLTIEKIPFRLDEVLHNITATISLPAKEKRLEFLLECAPDIPETLIGDPLRLTQILNNLAGNAVKFTETGRITIRINMESRTPEHVVLCFSITDTGIGLTVEQIGNLFLPFNQADASTTRKYGGTGLGLTICKRLVEQMEGTMRVESIAGKGSTFAFSLPFACPSVESLSSVNAQAMPVGRGNLAHLSGLHILLVEDNESNQQLSVALLERAGIKTGIAGDGLEALQRLQQESFDVVLMDIQMPNMDGLAATCHIRGNPAFTDLPIIAMTANAMAGDRESCLAAGMNDYISKPIRPEALYAALARWTGREAPTITIPEEQPASDSLPDLDPARAIARIGDEKIYLGLLGRFIPDQGTTVQSIRAALDSGDIRKAERLAHTLKGVAATIGAESLSDVARKLENAIHRECRENYSRLLDAVETRLDRASCSVASYLEEHPGRAGSTGSVPAPLDQTQLRLLLEQLAVQLEAFDSSAVDTMQQISQSVSGTATASRFAKLGKHIGDYDYENALTELQLIASDLT